MARNCKDLTGYTFGRLTVISRGENSGKQAAWICLCICGNIKVFQGGSLRNGKSKSCGCLKKEALSSLHTADLTGCTFGRLTVLHRVPCKPGTKKGVYWLSVCTCGRKTIVRANCLTRGLTQSCGCLHIEVAHATGKKKINDLSGMRFGQLTVTHRAANSISGETVWFVQCDCGNTCSVLAPNLVGGHTKSCGCLKASLVRERNPNWKGGRTTINKLIRNSTKNQQFRKTVFERDNFTCQMCGKHGGNLHAHHIYYFSRILRDNKISTFEEALACHQLWDVANGRTLCTKCHEELHRYEAKSRKAAKEQRKAA